MLTPNDKEKFLAELEEVPFPSVACKRAGIAKATIYRWRKEDAAFKKGMDAAMEIGRESITESAEAHTVMLIKKGEFRAIRLWLENNTTRYYKPKKAVGPPPRTITTIRMEIVDPRNDKKQPPRVVLRRKPPSGPA